MERKVRPIYEALDARNYKLSLKLCVSALAKGAGGDASHLLNALKAVSLLRLARTGEALDACRTVARSEPPPTEEGVLSTLMIVFKAANRLEEGAAAYEAAFAASPSSIELGHALFFVFMRSEEWGKAQQLAMRMYKQFGERYFLWVVTCLLLQADQDALPIDPSNRLPSWTVGTPPLCSLPPPKTLQLAAAMLGKSEAKCAKEAELQLHLTVAQRMGQPEAALKLLHNKGELIGAEVERLRTEAILLEELSRWEDAFALNLKLLTTAPDDWEAYTSILRCSLKIGGTAGVRPLLSQLRAEHPTLRGPLWGVVLCEYVETLSTQAAAAFLRKGGGRGRENWLAEAGASGNEVEGGVNRGGTDEAKQIERRGDDSGLREALYAYFSAFSSKHCCFLDTAQFLSALTEPQTFLAPLSAQFDTARLTEPPKLDWLLRYVCLSEWRVGCGECIDMCEEEREGVCAEWISVYNWHRPLSSELDARERGPGDPLLLLCAQLLLNSPTSEWFNPAQERTFSTRALVASSLALQMGLDSSPHNFQLKLAQMQCLLCLGAPSAAYSLYRSCDVKHIQNESLAYLILPALAELGAVDEAHEALQTVRRFQQEGLKDMADSLAIAFRSDNYVQALDFVALKRSLRCSWWHSLVGLLGLYHELRTKQACAADVLLSLADSSPLLSLDLTPSSLTSMPSPIDLRVFEEHSPARGGGRLRELLLSFLPSRLLLLKLLRATLAGEHVAVKEASALLLAHLGEEGTGESEEEEVLDVACSGRLESEVAAHFARSCARLAELEEGGVGEEGGDGGGGGEAQRLLDAFTREATCILSSLSRHCARSSHQLRSSGGYPPSLLAAISHLSQLALPLLSCVAQRWAQKLPGRKKAKKKKPAEEADAGGGGPREVVRDHCSVLEGALSQLEETLRSPELTSQSAVELQSDWKHMLGDSPAASKAVANLREALLPSCRASTNSLAEGVKLALVALRQTIRAL